MAKLRKMLGDPTGPRAKTLMNQYGNASIPGRIAVCNPITLSRYHPAEARQLGNSGVTRIGSRRRPAEARQLQQRRQFHQRRAGDDAANQRQQHAQEHHRTGRPLRPALLMAERPYAIRNAGHTE